MLRRSLAKPRGEVRIAHGVDGDVRFERDDTYPALGEAWRAVDGDDADQRLIWGDVVTNADGFIRRMNYDDAMEYCIGLNPESEREAIRTALKAGHRPKRGIYLPLRSDFAALRRQLGSRAKNSEYAAAGFEPQVLPNLNHWFWSSSVHPDFSNFAYDFSGRTGDFGYDGRVYADVNAVRCVARR